MAQRGDRTGSDGEDESYSYRESWWGRVRLGLGRALGRDGDAPSPGP